MKKLEKEFEVHRYDIRTSEKKIFKKYTETIRTHGQFDIRLDDNSSKELLTINEYSLEKIFSLMNEYPEEHILFLYLNEDKDKNKPLFIPKVDSSFMNSTLNSAELRLNSYETESNTIKPEIIKENKITQYYCIFCIIYFIMAGLITIHFLQFLFSKQVRI